MPSKHGFESDSDREIIQIKLETEKRRRKRELESLCVPSFQKTRDIIVDVLEDFVNANRSEGYKLHENELHESGNIGYSWTISDSHDSYLIFSLFIGEAPKMRIGAFYKDLYGISRELSLLLNKLTEVDVHLAWYLPSATYLEIKKSGPRNSGLIIRMEGDRQTIEEIPNKDDIKTLEYGAKSDAESDAKSRSEGADFLLTSAFVVGCLVMFVLFSCNTLQRWTLDAPNESQMRNDLIGWKMKSSSLIWSIDYISGFDITRRSLRGENDVLQYEVIMIASVSSDSKTETWTIQCKPITYQIEGNVIQGNAWKLISKQTRCDRYS